ncbi:MAG: hypothetical protein IID16_00800 [Candidatus Marinimicrobia bacterium]|nr:hypothetical protein [Candidatus Neomarinimicrobiota bacterium]
MKEFKIRASAAGNIMGIKCLGKTGGTYCKDWLKGQLFDYQKILKNKYFDKGIIMEDESIDFVADQLDFGFLAKNEKHFNNEFMQGTPDIVLKDSIIDVKNSWDCSTFPIFDTKINQDYYWQLQCYMNLCDKSKAKLIYCLLDTPDHLIHNEARWYSINQGFEELDNDIYEQFHNNMTYKNVPDKLKIKVFDIDRNDTDIQKIKDRVIECRSYIEQLKKEMK